MVPIRFLCRLPLGKCTKRLLRSGVTNVWYHKSRMLGIATVSSTHQIQRSFCSDVQTQNKYDGEVENFKLDVPEYFNFAADVLDKWAEKEKTGERNTSIPAFWWTNNNGDELKWSFQDLKSKSARTAKFLYNVCGIRKGDRVMVILHRVPEWWLLCLACQRIGAVLCPGSPQLTTSDIKYRLSAAKAMTIVTDEEHAVMVDQYGHKNLKHKILVSEEKGQRDGWLSFHNLYQNSDDDFEAERTRHDDLLMIYFTSGSTGNPKMVPHTHANLGIGSVIPGKYVMDLARHDVFWTLSDTGWVAGAYGLFPAWNMGTCVFVHHEQKVDPARALQILSSYPITHFLTAASVYRMMLNSGPKRYTYPHLKRCIGGAEAMNPDMMNSWKKATGCNLYEAWGQTETALLIGTFPGVKQRLGWIGKTAPGADIRIVDSNGVEQPNGTEGIIGVKVYPERPVGLFAGYLDGDHLNEKIFRGGYYLTGDRGIKDDEGYIRFVSRDDDVILSSGYRISPVEVENVLFQHPAVAESAVVSSPDVVRGEIVKAFVVLQKNYRTHNAEKLIKELQEHSKKITAPYKYPRKIEFLDELPKTTTNKIQRFALRNKEWSRSRTVN